MSHEVVHAIGGTGYFVIIFLFLWSMSVPRTNPGSGWWAISISCVLAARINMLLLLPITEPRLAVSLYQALTVLEKPFLLIGLTRFLKLDIDARWFWAATIAAEFWLVISFVTDINPVAPSLVDNAISAGAMLYMTWLILRNHSRFPGWPLPVAAAASLMLAVHRLGAPFLINYYPSWFTNGFLLGTILVMVQYLSLLAAVLSLFQTRLLSAEAVALDLAFLDPLTGLNNQRSMFARFDQALLLATRPHQIVAVIYIDLDNFKPINDTVGHAVGDEVLKTVAARLKAITRSTDICARVGGDEFVVICTQLDTPEQAAGVARKILSHLEKIPASGKTYALGASIGVSVHPQHGTNLNELLLSADQAMYQVKRNGKGGVAVFDAASVRGEMPDQSPTGAIAS